MPDVTIDAMSTSIEFEPEVVTSSPEQARQHIADIAELRALLRPVIIELLEDELGRYTRMRG